MKLYFGVKNLRSVDVEPPIELRPITILLGRNNVGKSTFLRTFPLLRQSTNVRPIGPLYWKAEVDFGDFATAVKHGHESEGIAYNFECGDFSISKQDFYNRSESSDETINQIQKAGLQIFLNTANGNAFRKKIELKVPEFDIKVEFNFSDSEEIINVLVNDRKLPTEFSNASFIFSSNELLPLIQTTFATNEAIAAGSRSMLASNIISYIEDIIRFETKQMSSDKRSHYEATKILEYPRFNSERIAQFADSNESKDFKLFFDNIKNKNDLISDLDTACSLYTALIVYDIIADAFSDVIKNSTYIGPSRAKSMRYHEISNLDFSELRVDGENLPAMLGSLDNEKLAKFSDWLEDFFGFGIYVEKRNGHISLFTKKGQSQVNFADSGFGISQLVPIALQIWWDLNLLGNYSFSSISPKSSVSSKMHENIKVLSIEQPELHLHPAHQSALADIFANSVKFAKDKKNKVKPAYIIETHSEPLVNRIGDLIEDGIISSEDVQILMFSKEDDELTSPTEVEKIEYNAEGYLEKWPYGFFRYKHVN